MSVQMKSEFESNRTPSNRVGEEAKPPSHDANYRRPLVAAVMSACLPGFGQLYNGQVNRAIWLFVAFCLVVAPVSALVALFLPAALMAPVMALWLLATICLWVWNIGDAWIAAKRLQTPARPWHMSGLYAVVFLGCAGLILPTIIGYVSATLVCTVKIVGTSMSPTLQAGDRLFIDRRVNCIRCANELARGDVVVFTFPNNRNQLHIKRLIGMPGDQIEISERGVTVNGKALMRQTAGAVTREAIDDRDWRITPTTNSGEAIKLTVPNGHAFLLGDNRGASKDSRAYGAVPLIDINGKARQLFFSVSDGSINWARIGHVVK